MPHRHSYRPIVRLLVFFALVACSGVGVHAATYTWTPSVNFPPGGTGNWNLTSPFWPSGGPPPLWPNTGADTALFTGKAGTVTTTAAIQVNTLTFNLAGYTLANGTGGSLTLTGGTATINGTASAIISASLGGAASLVLNGSGTISLSGSNTYSGGTVLNSGTLDLRSNQNSLGTGPLTINGGAISNNAVYASNPNFVDNVFVANPLTINKGFTYGQHNGGGLAFTGTIYLGGPVVITENSSGQGGGIFFGGPISGSPGAGITLQNCAYTSFSADGANTYTGPTIMDASYAQFVNSSGISVPGDLIVRNHAYAVLSNSTQLAASSNVTLSTGSQLSLGYEDETCASLDADSTTEIDFNEGIESHSKLFVGSGRVAAIIRSSPPPDSMPGDPNTAELTKIGPGTLTLSGDNTYVGGTLVKRGTLVVANTSGSGTGTGFVTVDSGGILSGNGTVSGVVTLLDGGLLNGALAIKGILTVNSGGVVMLAGSALTTSGGVINNGTMRLEKGASLVVANGSTFVNNGTLDIITGSFSAPAGFTNNGVVIDSSVVKTKGVTHTSGTLTVSVDAYTGHVYQLQRSDSLVNPTYNNIGTAQTGTTGQTLAFTDASTSGAQGFYRVVVDP